MPEKSDHHDHLHELLAERGFRVTGQRRVVLRELTKLRRPVSHAELTDLLAGQDLDRVTIYRNLLSLTEAGLLVKTQLGDKVWRFGLPKSVSADHDTHPHFICNDCGSVMCLPASSVVLRDRAANADVAEVQLRGGCGRCVGD